MSDPKQAHTFSLMARKDFRAMKALEQADVETFGFHADQAVEKAAKAWLCLLGIAIPRTHDLFSLFALIAQAGGSIEQRFESLRDLTLFAVEFRYSLYEDDAEPFDRAGLIATVDAFLRHVESLR